MMYTRRYDKEAKKQNVERDQLTESLVHSPKTKIEKLSDVGICKLGKPRGGNLYLPFRTP